MKIKVYISGKITGIESEAAELFAKAERSLQANGHDTVNPMTINHDHDKSWLSYMKAGIKEMLECSHVFMLSNWTDSKGAIFEHLIALNLGLKIIYQEPSISESKIRIS